MTNAKRYVYLVERDGGYEGCDVEKVCSSLKSAKSYLDSLTNKNWTLSRRDCKAEIWETRLEIRYSDDPELYWPQDYLIVKWQVD